MQLRLRLPILPMNEQTEHLHLTNYSLLTVSPMPSPFLNLTHQ